MAERAVSGRARDLVILLDRGIFVFSRHWLLLINAAVGIYAGLPLLAPYLLSVGYTLPAKAIYAAYSLTCHQLPSRSFFLFGYQVAYCQRCQATYTSIFLGGLFFALVRRRLSPLPWKAYLLLIAPMAVDGLAQIFGLRESTWQLRTITGALFGLASVWLAYPYLEQGMEEIQEELEAKFKKWEEI